MNVSQASTSGTLLYCPPPPEILLPALVLFILLTLLGRMTEVMDIPLTSWSSLALLSLMSLQETTISFRIGKHIKRIVPAANMADHASHTSASSPVVLDTMAAANIASVRRVSPITCTKADIIFKFFLGD